MGYGGSALSFIVLPEQRVVKSKKQTYMVWIIIAIIVVVVVCKVIEIGLLSYNKAKKERFLKDNPEAFPELGVLSSWFVFPRWDYDMDTILVSYETGKIYIGGKTFNILDITKLESTEHNGYSTTTYEDKTYIKTNTGSAIGRAVLGGAIAGGIGAVVGASTANREVKTERIAKTHYVHKSYGLYIEVNNVHEIVYISPKSKRDSDDVVAFINDEIISYNKYLKEKQEIQRLQKEEDAKIYAIAINKEINRFIQSPFGYSVDQLKIIDPQTQISKNHCFLSDNFKNIFADAIGISGIYLFEFGRKIFLCSKTFLCNNAINDFVIFKDYITSLFGNPLSEYDNETIKTLISNKEFIVIKWEKNGCAKLSAYYNYTYKRYNCTIEMYRIHNKSENVRAYNKSVTTYYSKYDNQQIDIYFEGAAYAVYEAQEGSVSMIQRQFAIGYNRACRLMDQLEAAGIVGPAMGGKPRDVFVVDENTLDMLIAKFRHNKNVKDNNKVTTNYIGKSDNQQVDLYFEEAAHDVVISQQCSISMILRRFVVDLFRAKRLMNQLEAAGIIGPAIGSNPREVLVEDENILNMLIAKFKSKTNLLSKR